MWVNERRRRKENKARQLRCSCGGAAAKPGDIGPVILRLLRGVMVDPHARTKPCPFCGEKYIGLSMQGHLKFVRENYAKWRTDRLTLRRERFNRVMGEYISRIQVYITDRASGARTSFGDDLRSSVVVEPLPAIEKKDCRCRRISESIMTVLSFLPLLICAPVEMLANPKW